MKTFLKRFRKALNTFIDVLREESVAEINQSDTELISFKQAYELHIIPELEKMESSPWRKLDVSYEITAFNDNTLEEFLAYVYYRIKREYPHLDIQIN